MGLKGYNEGEIVEVQGGHIIRATGLKDRHSKVLTSKGPRDRRVRLSAHTAIQFYDVQDRLGYDRPSKAVDWLIKKAKTAIEKLSETANTTLQEPGSPNLVNLDPEEEARTRTTTTPNLSQDLGLSLHPFQETNNFTTNHYERISGWNYQDLTMRSSSSSEQEERSNGGFMVNQHFHQPSMMTLINNSQQQQQVFLDAQQHHRGTLQSSLFPHSFRSWDYQMTSDHHHHHHHCNQTSHVVFGSSSQFGSHGEEATQQNTSSSSTTPNSHL